jgi:hypothetical protein
MRRSFATLSVAVLAAAPMIFGTISAAGARDATPSITAVALSRAASLPNSNIEQRATNRRVIYRPRKLTIALATTCDETQGGATVTNTTKKLQTITYRGKPFVTLRPHFVELFCAYGGPAQYVLGLTGSSSTLTLTVD